MRQLGRRSTFDVVEGFHLAHAVAALHEAGALAMLRRAQTAERLADRMGWDAAILDGVLEYVSARTDLIARRGAAYRTTARYETAARFLLDQYLGAYGPSARALPALLRDPSLGPGTVDRRRHAQAFARLERSGFQALPDLLRQLQVTRLLDLGCGSGTLLLGLARRSRSFEGWGVDANGAMCSIARQRLKQAGAAGRIRILRGDCRRLESAVPARVRAQVQAVSAASLLNEFFAAGDEAVIDWLRRLRRLFPGRLCLISDYYGSLGRRRRGAQAPILLHDFVQVLSGQGIPPAGRHAWRRIYRAAGCALLHVVEDGPATCFVHILRL